MGMLQLVVLQQIKKVVEQSHYTIGMIHHIVIVKIITGFLTQRNFQTQTSGLFLQLLRIQHLHVL